MVRQVFMVQEPGLLGQAVELPPRVFPRTRGWLPPSLLLTRGDELPRGECELWPECVVYTCVTKFNATQRPVPQRPDHL